MANLTPKQQRFVEEYLIDLNATQAAIRAGYSEKTAKVIAAQNLSKLNIQEAIQEAQNKLSERTGITQEYVLSNIQKVVERCMQQEAVRARDGSPLLVEGPEGDLTCLFEFKETGALKGLELLGKHLGLFKDKIEHTGKDGGPIDLSLKVVFENDGEASTD
ncbi:terminase small subunit [Acinetobacter sp. YH12140]|uniref:terminase small subunit n=1 Tax=Acinetobacter sp. YH12140 TaxID=2601124 RepID=UPI0015D30822|nr:terminase small subunit [Acinetobacter sp. YH12140]